MLRKRMREQILSVSEYLYSECRVINCDHHRSDRLRKEVTQIWKSQHHYKTHAYFMFHAASNFAWITRSAFWPTKSKVTQLETQNIWRALKHCILSIVNTKYRASIYTTIQCRIWRWEEFNALMRWRQSAKQHFTYNSINWPQKEGLFIRLYSFVAFTTERKSFCTRTISGIKTCPDTGPLLQCSNGLKENRSIDL